MTGKRYMDDVLGAHIERARELGTFDRFGKVKRTGSDRIGHAGSFEVVGIVKVEWCRHGTIGFCPYCETVGLLAKREN